VSNPRNRELRERVLKGGTRYLPKLREQHKLTARERLDLLLDQGSFIEDGLYANVMAEELPADGVVTGLGAIEGRQVAVMANDPTVKAGSWGARTVEKIVRIQEVAGRIRVPLFYLVDSAGARITDQIDMFPGRRHAGRIFFNEVQLSGQVPQICLLLGPSAAGGAYIPAFCDVVIMVEGNASMYLGSPRMVEVVVGEKVSLEELGGVALDARGVVGQLLQRLLRSTREVARGLALTLGPADLAAQRIDQLVHESDGRFESPRVAGSRSRRAILIIGHGVPTAAR